LRSEPPGDSLVLAPLLQEYLASPAINSRTDDDKSIILATRLTAGEIAVKDQNTTVDLGTGPEVAAEMTSDRAEM